MPLVVWLLLVVTGTGALLWQQNHSRLAVAHRFATGAAALGDFMTGVAAEQLQRQRVLAQAALSDPVVDVHDFDDVVAGSGYPSALLLDSRGRVIANYPPSPSLVGQDLGSRYAHLRSALQGYPTVSQVVPNAASGTPIVAFAVPFATPAGRRVLSAALPVRASPLATYFSTALSLTGARVQLVDTSGNIVAATDAFDIDKPSLALDDPALAAALSRSPNGRYHDDGGWWRYASRDIEGTPWRMSATVREKTLYASMAGSEITGRVALGGAALVGLVVVAAAGRARAGRRRLRLSEHRFRRIFDSSTIGMVLTDSQDRCLRVNRAVCHILGRTEREILGRLLDDFAHPDSVGRSAGPRIDCLAGRRDGFDLDQRYLRPDGQVVEASITSAVLRTEDGRPPDFATQIIDTTRRRTLERQRERDQEDLARHVVQLQDANTHLADVMAMLSHDVRQPLTAVVGLGGLLHERWTAVPEHTRVNYVQRMTAAGQRANDLVTDILLLAQSDAGAMLARPAHLDIARSVREAVAAHHLSAGTPVSVIASDEATGLADPAQLQLILGNLLTNASKYGRPPIEVTVATSGDQVLIRVADHGEGVPPEFVPHLFDRFARAGTGVATTTVGTGLGLYLVRQLAQAGGLDIAYEPHQPSGAVFIVTAPRTAPAPTLTPVRAT